MKEDFGSLLGQFRFRAGLSQQELADKANVHRNTINKWENRTSRPETRGQVLKLADELCLNKDERKGLLEAVGFSVELWPVELWHVPYPRDPFFTDREEVLKQLRLLLAPSDTTALPQALTGLGGIGKTHTAIEYAYRFRQYYHAVLWLQAESRDTLISECVKLARELGLPERDEVDQIVKEIQRWLRKHRHWLLILDNVEDLQLLSWFVPKGHQGSVLVTTQVYDAEPLAESQFLSTMPEPDGVFFLLHRTKKIPRIAQLDQASQEQYHNAQQIWQLMDGLPLALDQAGAYILETGCSFLAYQEQYTRRYAELLRRRGKRPIGHPESVMTTFSLVFERVKVVNPLSADILRACALLHGNAIPEELFQGEIHYLASALSANPDCWDTAIATLRDYSLVQRNSDKSILTIHSLVQAVLKDLMMEEEEFYESWAQRVVLATSQAFPSGEYDTWHVCERLLPQVFACSILIKEDWAMTFEDGRATLLEAARLFHRAGYYLYHRAQYSSAEPLLKQALKIRRQQLGKDHATTISSLNNLAMLYYGQGKYPEAEPLLRQILEVVQRRPKGNVFFPELKIQYLDTTTRWEYEYSDIATALNNLAMLYLAQGKYAEAEPLLKQTLDMYQEQFGIENPGSAKCISNLAEVYRQQKKYKEAEPLFNQALITMQQTRGKNHPEVAQCLNNLATLYDNMKNYEKAVQFYKEAVHTYQQLNLEHPDIARSLNNLATLYYDQGKYEEAEPLYQQVLEIRQQYLGLAHPDTVLSLVCLAQFYETQRKYKQAASLYKQTLQIAQKSGRDQSFIEKIQAKYIALRNSIEEC